MGITEQKAFTYTDLRLDRIHCFKVISVDEFQKYQKRILTEYKESPYRSEGDKEELKKKLSIIKKYPSSISMGGWGDFFIFELNMLHLSIRLICW